MSRKVGPEVTENTHMNFMRRFYVNISVNMALAWAIKLKFFVVAKIDNNLRGCWDFLRQAIINLSRIIV